jgi:hypothetical protein
MKIVPSSREMSIDITKMEEVIHRVDDRIKLEMDIPKANVTNKD